MKLTKMSMLKENWPQTFVIRVAPGQPAHICNLIWVCTGCVTASHKSCPETSDALMALTC